MSPGLIRPVEFATPAGAVLRGLLFAGGRRCAVLLHDLGYDLDRWRAPAAWLAARGVSALTLDLPGHGASDGPDEVAAWPGAALAALAFANASGLEAAGLVAEGLAGAAALAVAAASPDAVRAAVLASPVADARIAEFADLREARLPKLILVGSDSISAERFYRGAIGPCELVQLPVAERGAELFTGELGEQACEKTLAHLLRFG